MATTINNSTTGILTTPDATGNLVIQTASSNAIVIDNLQKVGIGITPAGLDLLELGAGNATIAPLGLNSGTLLTTADAGSVEYDGKAFYMDAEASQRGVVNAEQFITLTSNYTTGTGTTQVLKQLFNSPASGTLTVAGSTTYFFECMFNLTSMSSTSGTFSFGLAGSATYSSVLYTALANKTATTVQTAQNITLGTVATVTILIGTANTTTTGYAMIKGKVVIGTGGTIIPSFALSTAAAAVVNTGSYFRIVPVGSNTVQSVGNWA